MPDWFVFLEPAVLRGYDARGWIRYETGQVVAGKDVEAMCGEILGDPTIAFVDVRSKFGCFQCRVERD